MSAFLLGWFRLIGLFTRGHQALVLENLALRQQLAVYKRHSKRPRLRRSDRLFWVVLAGLWKGWRRALGRASDCGASETGEARLRARAETGQTWQPSYSRPTLPTVLRSC